MQPTFSKNNPRASKNMKTAAILSIATILFLSSAIPCSIATGIPEGPNYASQDGGQQPPIAANTVNDEDNELDVNNEYHFTQEEIDKNRMITIHWNGDEEVSTDEEVIRTLEYVGQDNSSFLFNEPHFTHDIEKRDIIGTDDRFHRRGSSQRNAPYSAIGYLSTGCTAYLVGPRHLVTAAHCVTPPGNTGAIIRPATITFHLRRNCHIRGLSYTISDVMVYSQYRYQGDDDYDIAYLLLSSSVNDWMGYAYKDPMPTVSGEICGYPGDKISRYSCFYCSKCNDVKRTGWIFKSNTRLRYTCDTEGGMSGSPVITDDHDSTSNLYSYGVHTHGHSKRNEGVRISKKYFFDICRWKCNTGVKCSAVC